MISASHGYKGRMPMYKKVCALVLFVVGSKSVCFAGDDVVIRPQFFAGYSVTRSQAATKQGWQLSMSVGRDGNGPLSWVGDVGGQYGQGTSAYQYVFGPRLNVSSGGIASFAHALYGVSHRSAADDSSNGFLMMYGGGT